MRQSFTRVLLTGLLIVGCTPKSSDSGGSGGSNGSGGGNGSSSGGNNGSSSGGGNGSSSGGSNGSSSGGKTGSGGGNGSSSGGSNGSSSGGSNGSSSGGSNGSGSGGSNGSGSGGASGTACTPDTSNLVNTGSWVCDADTPIKFQGAFYVYSDSDMSCKTPSPNKPCGGMGCCVSGTTTISDDTTMYANWGCGLGMELNSTGGTAPVKTAYTGPVNCFNITLTGSSGGNAVRIGFTQSTDTTAIAPYVDIGAIKDGFSQKICFTDAACPTWTTAAQCSKKTGEMGTPYDLQIQISAGATATTVGAYNLCLSKLEPIYDGGGAGGNGGGGTGSGGSSGGSVTCQSPSGGPGSITDPFGTAMVSCGSQQYVVQNNDWGAKMGETLSYGRGTTMKVTQQTGVGQNNNPASFPSIFIGQNSSHSSGDTPKAVSSIKAGDLPTSWTWADNGATGSYNAAYDVWFSTGSGGEPTASAPSGGFLMVWYHKPSDNQPIGTMMGTANIAGVNWNIWEGNNSGNGKPCITYQAVTTINTLSFKLGDFIRDAVDKQKYLQDSWYLTNVFAGFEIWNGGQGLETKDFTATMK